MGNQDLQAERKKKEVAEVSSFNKKLNETKTNEKNTLPTEEVIAAEKKARHADVAGVVSFNKDKLKKTNTNEKNTLPTSEVITAEKKARHADVAGVISYDKSQLNKTDTNEKNP